MATNLVIHRNPFRPNLDVEERSVDSNSTIFQTLEEAHLLKMKEEGFERIGTYVVLHNGEALVSKDWNIVLKEDDVLQVAYLPKGGGGGSNIKSIIGAIIIAVAAYFTFGLSLVATAAVGVGALAVLSLMSGAVPIPSSNSNTSESSSPTYSLSAQSNVARLLEAIPKVYGNPRVVPDLASQPYTEYEANELVLYQLFCVSLGQCEIEKIYVDETPLDQFTDAQYVVINPGEAVTLFPDNVVTSDAVNGIEMVAPNNPGYNVLGPYISAPSGTKASTIGIDLAFPQGSGNVDDDGNTQPWSITVNFQYQEVNDAGQAIGSWNQLFTKTFNFSTKNAQLITVKTDVPLGRYQIQGSRVSNESASPNVFGMVQWTGLRSYLQSTYTYGNVTLIAVKMRATAALNSTTARKFSAKVKDRVQTWDPVNGWGAYVYSDGNPAWIAADILRDLDYGRGLGTDRLAMTKLYQLSQTFAARGDRFHGVFDTTAQLWDSLSKVLRCGRTVPIYYAGVIDFIRDQPQSIPSGMFQPSNMIMGSFKTTYNFFDVDTPDHIVVEYIDPATNKPATVECKLPGETALNPFNVNLFGCQDRDQAFREGMSLAASNRDRRRSISFSTLSAGYIPRYNGLIRISHDTPLWGYSGRVKSFNKTTGRLRTTEPVIFGEPVLHVIAFRTKRGGEDGPYTIVEDSSLQPGEFGCIVQGTDQQPISNIYISDGVREDFTFYQCGPTQKEGLKALVMSAAPDGQGQVNITCINYADSVYSAENGGVVPPPNPASNLPGTPTAPIINSVTVVYTIEVGVQNIVATPAAGAIFYEFEARTGGGEWAKLGNNSMPTLISHLSPGVWSVRVRGVGRSVGPWTTWTGTIEATTLPTPKLDLFTATTKLFAIGLAWAYEASTNTIADKVEVWAGITNVLGNSSKLITLPYPASGFDHINLGAGSRWFYWARVIDTAGRVGPWYNNALPISQTSSTEAQPVLDLLFDKLTKSQFGQDLKSEIDGKATTAYVNQQVANLHTEIGNIVDALLYVPTDSYVANNTVRVGDNLWTAITSVPAKADGSNGPPNPTYWINSGQVLRDSQGYAAAINKNTTDISNLDGTVKNQATQISAVQTSLKDKADSSTVNQLSSTVSQQGSTITSQGQAITAVTNKVNDPATGLAATSSAVNTLDGKVTTIDGKVSANTTAINGVYAQVNPPLAGETTSYAGSTQAYVGVYSVQSALIEGDMVQGKRTDTIQVQLNDANAAIQVNQSATITAQNTANNANSAAGVANALAADAKGVATTANTTANTANNKANSLQSQIDLSYQVKLQANANGSYAWAGYGLTLNNASGVFYSQFVIAADDFIIATTKGANYSASPFAVVGNQTFIKEAFIQKATVQNLLVGATFTSVATNSQGLPVYSLNLQTGAEVVRYTSSGYLSERTGSYWRLFVDGLNAPLVEMGVLWVG